MKFAGYLFAITVFLANQLVQAQKQDLPKIRTLIVFFDGLRPDYITREQMPNLYAFREKACYGAQHHSVFPTVTRVNASSYSTGSYPATHGLMGNTVYFPQVDPAKGLNTGEASEMMKVADATGGNLLTAISLGEILKENGHEMMVFSSGSSGQALMQNHKVAGSIINTSLILPESIRQKVIGELGPIPPNAKPNKQQHTWITNGLIRYGLRVDGPLVSAIWFSDPDGAAHSDGIGSPLAIESLKSVDHEFGRIISALNSSGLTNSFNIIISTDHGFVTYIGKQAFADFLVNEGLKATKESQDVVVTEGAVYVNNHDAEKIKKIVVALQAQEWVGALFTRAKSEGSTHGFIEGTLSFDAVHWNHKERAADILVSYNWSDKANAAGYKGSSYANGVAGHGSMSPYEIDIALLASGPSFKRQFNSQLPSSNVDIVPTLLYIHKMAIPQNMNGRVLHELLIEKEKLAPMQPEIEITETSTKYQGGIYRLTLNRTILGKHKYVNFAKVVRE